MDPASLVGAPSLPREALTPHEFREAPAELETELAQAWDDRISPADASKPLFWLLCHLEWIEQGRFGPDRMHAFFTEGGGRGDTLDSRTRTFLRRTGGPPHVRGNVSVLTDCPLARALWRVRIAAEVAEDPDSRLTQAEAHDVLRAAGQVWNEIAQMGRVDVEMSTAVREPGGSDDYRETDLRAIGSDPAWQARIVDVTLDALSRYERVIVFCPSVQSAIDSAREVLDSGRRAAVIVAGTPDDERKAQIAAFRSAGGGPMAMFNYGVLTAGFDAPRTQCAIIARPTTSLVLYSQMVGRAMRGRQSGAIEFR